MTMNTTSVTSDSGLSLDEMMALLDPVSPAEIADEPVAEKTGAMADLDSLSAQLDALDAAVVTKQVSAVEAVIPTTTVDSSEDLDAVLSKLSDDLGSEEPDLNKIIEPEPEPEEAKAESVAVAAAVVDPADAPVYTVAAKPRRKRKAAAETGGSTEPAKPREPRSKMSLDDLTDEDCGKIGVDKAALVEAYEKCPVKAKDKVVNLIQWAVKGNELSVYTQLCIENLIKNNTSTSEMFRLHMMSNPTRPYPAATAGSQAGQLMAVLPALNIADRVGKNLTLKADSPIVKLFVSQMAA
ncbi:hypothetical protein L9H26_18960 [Morganella psychrotolerans]|uniref:Uncharacterized protein n=1 Tax=Morganella psychrotolerans TaxID=368603 RepID=A0A5M9QWR6_9GAMM|nr:hypothetical protein [Morganella psychrotolerans]KAA8712983.1 hypothetical protein F4V73_17860 [Morganella psychrotolerans]OBU01915.1 hypothetical protein AYY16_17050 [Morganella psychrotolerans]